MDWIEVEGDDVAMANRRIEYRGPANQIPFPPDLPADQDWRATTIAPLQHNIGGVGRTVEAGGAVSHTQPASRRGVERKILAEDPTVRLVPIGDRVIGAVEGDAKMRTGRAHERLRRCCGGFRTAALRTARQAAGVATHSPN